MNDRTRPLNLLGGAMTSTLLALMLVPTREAAAQGCVAIRSVGNPALPGLAGLDHALPWQVTVAHRYFESDRYFMGTDELSDMPGMAPGQQVINEINTLDFAVSYAVTPQWTFTLDLPVVFASRTSREEHMGMMDFTQPQFTTRANGIGDLRVTGDYWILDPERYDAGNISVGIGFKAPTGEYDAEDDFHTPAGVVRRPVDTSIQPGDGGWGMLLQAQGFHRIVDHLSLYLSGLYQMNPREENGVRSFSMKPVDANGRAFNEDHVNSVTDQYLARLGFNYVVWPKAGLSVSFGARLEGVPVEDAWGGSGGFRRPGYTVSVEPGLNWMKGRHQFTVTAPVAVERNRQRSLADEAYALDTNEMLRIYPGSFSDWNLFASYTLRF